MQTERPSPRFADIDVWESGDVLEAMIAGQFAAVAAVRACLPAIANAAQAVEARLRARGRLVYVGAGTSGRLAVQDGAELIPTFGWPTDRLVLLIAGGTPAMARAIEGAEDQADSVAELMLAHSIGRTDALIAVAASGTTPFTLACVCAARERGALTIGIANNQDTPLLRNAEHAIYLDTGAEPIAGSTRMNAGTAQRVVLALLSTLVMIRLGHVYRGLMVDVHATNAKLSQRKKQMLLHLTGAAEQDAEAALLRSSGDVKMAVLLLKGCDLQNAHDFLLRAGGNLRRAIEMFAGDG